MKNINFKNGAILQALAKKATTASIQTRLDIGADLITPICIYDLCDHKGITVRFNDINMEGMYERAPRPRIHISALRPLARRNFTCAHELGHHVFGHGSTIDELKESGSQRNPDEYLADTFAAHLLMPVLGIRNAFARRGVSPNVASPCELYSIACNFRVGYSTLINHLVYSLHEISIARSVELLKCSPKLIRSQVLGISHSENLTIVDEHWTAATLDTEIGSHILLPKHVQVSGATLELGQETEAGNIYRATASGITRAASMNSDLALFNQS